MIFILFVSQNISFFWQIYTVVQISEIRIRLTEVSDRRRNGNRWSWWATGTEDSGNKLYMRLDVVNPLWSEKRKPFKLVSYWYGGHWQQIMRLDVAPSIFWSDLISPLFLWSQAKAADKCCRWYVDGTWFVPHLRKIGYCLSWKILIVFSCTTSHDT